MASESSDVLQRSGQVLRDAVSLLRRLSKEEQWDLKFLESYLSDKEFDLVVKRLKQSRLKLKRQKQDFSFMVGGNDLLPVISSREKSLRDLNVKIRKKFYKSMFKAFSERAWTVIPYYLAPSVVGQREVKQTAMLQMLVEIPLQIALVGPEDSDNEEVLRGMQVFAPLASYSDGKGALEFLELSDGVQCVSNASELSDKTLGKLISKAADMDVGLLVSIGPKSRKKKLINALPFKPKFLGEFHTSFLMKKTELTGFEDITDQLIVDTGYKLRDADLEFMRQYLKHAASLTVGLPPYLHQKVKSFVQKIKAQEKKLPFEIGPLFVEGLLELIKASARVDLREEVTSVDLDRVFTIAQAALEGYINS
jgi:hypothetical protein